MVTVLLGAYYPAIDLTAGEKERGSIQTLFTAPIAESEIVAGKYLAVVCIAMISGFANLVSIVLVIGQGLNLAGDLASEFDLALSFPLVLALMWNIFLISLLFSAVLLAVAVLARSFKEAQTYITPVYLLCIVPGVLAQLPGVEYSTILGTIPGVGAVVLMKSLLLDGVSIGPLVTTTIASLVWTALALLMAARLFGQESVIFGERASLTVFPKRSEIARTSVPSMSAGLAWGAITFLLLFYVGATWQRMSPQIGLAATLWIALLAPTLFLAWYSKVDMRHTFQLRAPSPRALFATVLLGVSALWVVNGVNTLVEVVLPTPDGMAEEMAQFFGTPDSAIDWILLVLLFSVSPAICEEAIFRGYLFTSLRDRVSPTVCVAATAIAFGAFHLSIYRFAGTAMLGIVMGVLAWRTRSIWTSVLFHAINNGIAVALIFFAGADAVSADIAPATVAITALAGLVGCALGFWLLWGVRTPPPAEPATGPN
ncbi:MAG: sodium transport system permease protein [Bradymonadia bacterium]